MTRLHINPTTKTDHPPLDSKQKGGRHLNRVGLMGLFAPILFFEVYLTVTFIFFRFGPWEYFNKADANILFFTALYQIALAGGYIFAHHIYIRPKIGRANPISLIRLSIIANIIFFIPTSLARTGDIFPNVIAGILNPGDVYSDSQIYRSTGVGALIEYLRIISGFLLFAYLPLTIFFWSTISKRLKWLFFLVVIMNVSLFISMGTNRILGEYAVLIPSILAAAGIAGRYRINSSRVIFLTIVGFSLFIGFSSYFSSTMATRSGSFVETGFFEPGNTRLDYNNKLVNTFPVQFQKAAIGLSSYMGQGYFALGLALREPFIPMYGIGSSPFLLRQYESITGDKEAYFLTYPSRIEKYGWRQERYWSSIYVWLASDLSFWGVAVFCFLIGSILYTTWRDTIESWSMWGVMFLALNMLVVFYFSAANQIGQNGEALSSYLVIGAMWWLTRSGWRIVLRRGI